MDPAEQWEERRAALHIELAHNIIDQQDRGRTMQFGEIFGLGHLQRDDYRALLSFTPELRGGTSVYAQEQLVPVRTDRGDPAELTASLALAQFHQEIIFD